MLSGKTIKPNKQTNKQKPVFGLCSTQTLVKIYSLHDFRAKLKLNLIPNEDVLVWKVMAYLICEKKNLICEKKT